MRLSTVFALASAALASCAATPVSHPELPGQTAAEFVCSHLAPAEAKARLHRAWNKCYLGPELKEMTVMVGNVPIVIPAGSNETTQVVSDGPEDGGSLSVRLPRNKQVLHARFLRSPSCPSLVTVDSGPALWVSAARNTRTWLDDPNAPGPATNCK